MSVSTTSRPKGFLLASISAACLVMTGCGGGGNSDTPVATTPTPTPTPTPPPTSGGDCDGTGNVFSVIGNNLQMKNNIYAADGNTIAMTQVNDYVIHGGTTFKGTGGLIEIAQTTNVTSGIGAGTTALTQSYYSFGATESKTYGIINTSTVLGFSIAATITFDPSMPWPTNPALNTPYSNTFKVLTEGTGLPSTTQTRTEVRTFSVEQVTTLAGTFSACKVKYDVTTDGSTVTSYSWQVGTGRLKGHELKSASGAGVRTMEATALLVNGS